MKKITEKYFMTSFIKNKVYFIGFENRIMSTYSKLGKNHYFHLMT